MLKFDTFLEIFSIFGALCPRAPIRALLYSIHYFSHSAPTRKLKNSEKLAFSRIFSIIFQIFINLNAYF